MTSKIIIAILVLGILYATEVIKDQQETIEIATWVNNTMYLDIRAYIEIVKACKAGKLKEFQAKNREELFKQMDKLQRAVR